MIPHSKPWMTPADVEAVEQALRSSMIGGGSRVAELETRVSEWVQCDGGVAVGSGSAAVLLALLGIGVGSGDDVVLPTYVCASVLDAVVSVGARPVLCDVGPRWVVTPADVERVLTAKTRAIVVPHMYGIFADVHEFRVFERPIVEDCAQAVGARGRHPIRGDVGVLSFHPTKCLTTGEGGMVVGDRRTVAAMRARRDGTTPPSRRVFSPLSDVAAALGLSQLARYHDGLARRAALARGYAEAIGRVAAAALPALGASTTMHFRFPMQLPFGLPSVADRFAERGVTVRRGVDQLLHRSIGEEDDGFPTACRLFDTTVMLPIYPALTDEEHAQCIDAAAAICPTALGVAR